MDSEEEEDFNRVTRLAQALVGCDICLVTLVDDQRQFFKSSLGLPEDVRAARQTPLSYSFCKIVVATEQPLMVEDARADARVASNPAIRELDVISYLGIPIMGPEGEALGSFCAIDRRPRVWSDAEQAAMRDFTHLLENVIKVRIHARDAIRAATSNAVLAHEYNHRIKNSYAVSAGLVRAAGRNADSIEALVRDCADRFASLGRAQDLIIGEHETTDLGNVVAAVLKPFACDGNCGIDGPRITLAAAQVTPLALLLHELATNSIKYGALRDGREVKVNWRSVAHEASLVWLEPTGRPEDEGVVGFGTKVLEIATRQLAGRMARGYADGVLHVEMTFPVQTAAAGDADPA